MLPSFGGMHFQNVLLLFRLKAVSYLQCSNSLGRFLLADTACLVNPLGFLSPFSADYIDVWCIANVWCDYAFMQIGRRRNDVRKRNKRKSYFCRFWLTGLIVLKTIMFAWKYFAFVSLYFPVSVLTPFLSVCVPFFVLNSLKNTYWP